MKLEYTLELDSLLTFQLYAASQSSRIKKQRMLGWFLVALISFSLVPIYLWLQFYIAAALLGAIGLFWIVLYPFYSRWRYRRHYRKHIQDGLKGMLNRRVSIELNDEIVMEDESARTQIKLNHINSVVTIPDYALILMGTGQAISLPRRQLGESLDAFLQSLLTATGLEIINKPDWRWR
ncbi:MAG: YcxB family protein [Leptospiraceae bacterium]